MLRRIAVSFVFVLAACHSESLNLPAVGQGASPDQRSSSPAAQSRGVIFKTLFDFGNSDGGKALADLVNVRGTLYGTTSVGGGASACGYVGCGTVFKITTSGSENVLHSFHGGPDGANPLAGLVYVDGNLYGTTELGGDAGCGYSYGCGTVFKITTSGKKTVLHNFKGGTDGEFPYSVLVDLKGTLYGTTRAAGDLNCVLSGNGCGTVFAITTSGRKRLLHIFEGSPSDGAAPLAGLTNVNGTLYGTTSAGGSRTCSYGCGTVFRITTSGRETVIYKFKGGSDGALPRAGLIYADGAMYGTTSVINNQVSSGTVFKITTLGKKKILHQFSKTGLDGAQPAARLTYLNGVLYGTTYLGGANDAGAIFKVVASGKESVLHSFTYYGSEGVEPAAGLTEVNGNLYGTSSGGASGACQQFGCGAVFELTP